MAGRTIGDVLIEAGAVTPEQLRLALSEQKRCHKQLGELVVDLGFATHAQLSQALAVLANARYMPLATVEPDPSLGELIDLQFATQRRLVPIALDGRLLTIAVVNPLDIVAVDHVRERTGLDVEIVVATEQDIATVQGRLYRAEDTREALDQLIETSERAVTGEQDSNELAPVIRLVEALIEEAVRQRATDIHFEPEARVVRIRCRVDGVLLTLASLPLALRSAATARLKILAGLDISESRLPQDGRIQIPIGRRRFDMRVSTIPTVHGENVVLRVLDKTNLVKGLDALGMGEGELEALKQLLATQSGMVLVTGPTGSGKTTTLYSSLTTLDASRYKVATLEDPVEYELPLIRQCQVQEKIGFGFAEGLRSLLRQDPDVIFVGEMRDTETAGIAVRAALTGHLVLSTLHTTCSIGTLNRLVQMEIPKDLIATSLRGVLAQRLVRRVCSNCAEPAAPDPVLFRRLGLSPDATGNWRVGRGCERCSNTGYLGRTGVYELVRMTPRLSDAFAVGRPLGELTAIAAAEGTRFLRTHGMELAAAGTTTLEEVRRATADIATDDAPTEVESHA